MKTIGIIGNPNCGKTTIFNALTGSRQHIGNWPGVTVEKKEGEFALPGAGTVKLVDLPGIYSLTAASEDEKASLEYVLSHEADLYINIIDATAIERNLYLTLLMCELKVPMVIVVTMMDVARQRRTVSTLSIFPNILEFR
jgi:ferrous iron transport protein B